MFVSNFKILGQVVPEKSLTKKTNSHYIGVRDRKIEKEGKNKSQHLGFVFSNTFGCPHHVYKIYRPCLKKEAEKSVIENFVI